jgi:hypothetical protein
MAVRQADTRRLLSLLSQIKRDRDGNDLFFHRRGAENAENRFYVIKLCALCFSAVNFPFYEFINLCSWGGEIALLAMEFSAAAN